MVTGDEWWRLLPPGTSGDALRVLAARGVRAFADGFVALLLPIWLVDLGFNPLAVGAIVASTLIGTALLTLWVEMIANRHSRRMLLLAASVLMAATGVAFATVTGPPRNRGGRASWVFSHLFSDRGWGRGMDFEVGEDRR